MKYVSLIIVSFLLGFKASAQSVTIMPDGKVEQESSSASLLLLGAGVPEMSIKKSLGTLANPSSVTFNNALFQLNASGYNGIEYTSPRARLRLATSEVWSTEANGTKIQFYTTANGETDLEERLRITDRGLIGVGTNSPEARFDVSHESSQSEPTLRLFETGLSTPSRIHFKNEGFDSYWYINAQHANYGVNHFSIGSSVLADVFSISSLGRVGIHQTNPQTRLHLTGGNFTVDHTEPKILLKRSSTSMASKLVFHKPDNSEGAEITQEGSDLFIHTGNTKGLGLTISATNKVGIGTDSPAYGLHIAKTGESQGATSGILSIGSDHHMNLDGNEIDAYTYINTGNKLYLNANSQENVEVGKTGGTGNLVANNYTQLGNNAPQIKQKLIEGNTHVSNSSTHIPHGLDFHKIISVQVHIYKEAHVNNTIGEAYYPSGGGLYTYYYQFNATNITLLDVNTNLRNQPYKVLVTYKD